MGGRRGEHQDTGRLEGREMRRLIFLWLTPSEFVKYIRIIHALLFYVFIILPYNASLSSLFSCSPL